MRPELQAAVAAVKSGDAGALERALGLLQQTVFSFSMKVCGHREDAEDTAQETLLRTAPHLPKFESPEALSVWLYKVARSRCLMSRRRGFGKVHIPLDEVLPDRRQLQETLVSAGPGPERQLLRKENAAELQRAVLRIPPGYRQVLVLHDMEELSTREVARITGLREGTVRVRLHRARALLRNQLAPKPRAPRKRRAPGARPRVCRRLFAALSDYLDGELDSALCARLESHLDGCAPCQAYLDSLEETVRRCRDHCPESFKRKLRGDLRQMVERALAASRGVS
jgi:RNA polymerase sigma-70 factor (ECF subfamily)